MKIVNIGLTNYKKERMVLLTQAEKHRHKAGWFFYKEWGIFMKMSPCAIAKVFFIALAMLFIGAIWAGIEQQTLLSTPLYEFIIAGFFLIALVLMAIGFSLQSHCPQ